MRSARARAVVGLGAAALLAVVAGSGCELIASVDRSLIPGGCSGASDCADATVPPLDATVEAAGETGSDSGLDSTPDALLETGSDAGRDASPDASSDASSDAAADAPPDASSDAPTDASLVDVPDAALGCTVDSECTSGDCACGASSGNCLAASGTCGAAKTFFDVPTTDGAASSGAFVVPARCSSVYVEAWSAGGGSGGASALANPGGAGGYVAGAIPVVMGDVLTAWIGQGGALTTTTPGGTPGIGSLAGVLASGESGDGNPAVNPAGGSGGGLTSVKKTGSATVVFSIPAGSGASGSQPGNAVGVAGTSNGTANAGGNTTASSNGGGGGAGAPGGAGGGSMAPGSAGVHGTLPGGFTSANSTLGVNPANTTARDYSLCGVVSGRSAATGGPSTAGGNGCVVFRCVAP